MGLGNRDYYRPQGFGGFSFFPPVIKNLLIINAVVFFVQMLFDSLNFSGMPGWYVLNRYFALNPLAGVDQAGQPYNFQIWQLLTYQFMHGDFSHILFNMFMLWMFGMEIENAWGSKKFLIFYIAGGLGAGLLQLIAAPFLSEALAPTIGASGAVYAVMVAFAMFFPNRYIYIYFLLPVKAKYLITFLIVFEFLSVGNMDLVAHLAHIGGALTGLIFILIDKKNEINVDQLFAAFRKNTTGSQTFKKFKKRVSKEEIFGSDVEDAKFYDIEESDKSSKVDENEINRILDKISKSGYQNLTEREKKILFEASKHN